ARLPLHATGEGGLLGPAGLRPVTHLAVPALAVPAVAARRDVGSDVAELAKEEVVLRDLKLLARHHEADQAVIGLEEIVHSNAARPAGAPTASAHGSTITARYPQPRKRVARMRRGAPRAGRHCLQALRPRRRAPPGAHRPRGRPRLDPRRDLRRLFRVPGAPGGV